MDKETYDEIYRQGKKDGIREYAWMKNGIFYVGTTGKTLKEALNDVDREDVDVAIAVLSQHAL